MPPAVHEAPKASIANYLCSTFVYVLSVWTVHKYYNFVKPYDESKVHLLQMESILSSTLYL